VDTSLTSCDSSQVSSLTFNHEIRDPIEESLKTTLPSMPLASAVFLKLEKRGFDGKPQHTKQEMARVR
jgi:hypothetical protein